MPKLRTLLPEDADKIKNAFVHSKSYRSVRQGAIEKATVNLLIDDVDYLVKQITDGEVQSVVIDEAYLLVYSICNPWYSKTHYIVSEELVLRIGSGSSFEAVIETLELIRGMESCSGIITGGALSHSSRALTRMYERHGFKLETSSPQHTKLGG